MPNIHGHTDDRDWQRGVDELLARIVKNTYVATNQAALLIEREGKRRLRRYTHPRGTPTPSPAGVGPPALVSGHLRRSWKTVPAYPGRKPWTIEARTGPTAVYARIQELGGEITQVRTRRMRRVSANGAEQIIERPYTHQFRLPKRPYVKPTVNENRRNMHWLYVEYWTRAILFS
ncbi:MAG TPA: hypothetical protein DGT23_22475 [Micromonosporaceae bacterium]|nr:hypothetical protein [Micromonosporaceae bacterium]